VTPAYPRRRPVYLVRPKSDFADRSNFLQLQPLKISQPIGGKPGEAYNIASGVETTIKELAETINALTGNNTPMNIQPTRDWNNSGRRFGSTGKSRTELGFVAKTSIEEGLRQTVEWTRTNFEMIRERMCRHSENMTRISPPH